jgi:hypothetical protein
MAKQEIIEMIHRAGFEAVERALVYSWGRRIVRSFITTSFLILTVAVFQIHAQRLPTGSKSLLRNNRPAVYLTFLRMSVVKWDDPSTDPKNLFFRITNNSRWPVSLQMSGAAKKEYGDVSLYYAIEDKKTGTIERGSTGCHVCSVNSLNPGRSLIFSIPLSEASLQTRMRITYSFDWERGSENYGDSDSEHAIIYYFSNLPASILKSGSR